MWRVFTSVVVLCASPCFMPNAIAAPRALPVEVVQALQRAQVPREALVAVVQELGGQAPLLAWQAERPVNPASIMKLVTTNAALDLLGPAWTWNTPVWLDGTVKDGMLEGNLVIKGTGDPKLVLERVWMLLRRVQQLGVHDIRGDIVLDRSAFASAATGAADFDGEPLRPYNVQPDALLLNYGSLLLTFIPDPARGIAAVAVDPPLEGMRSDTSVPLTTGVCEDWRGMLKADFTDASKLRFAGSYPGTCGERQWPVAYAEPVTYNARLLTGLWREMGGHLTGSVREGAAPMSRAPTFTLVSPPLAEVVRDINKFSNNVMAQQLFLSLAYAMRGQGSPEAARQVVTEWLAQRFGEDAASTRIDNGSGLSRQSRTSAALLARLLQHAYAHPTMPELMSSLPVTGLDGTMLRTKTHLGRAHLKSGSLRDVTGVAGYVLSNSGRRYVLVGIINHPAAGTARGALEALVQWTAGDGRPVTEGTPGRTHP
jgi:D-alanyl-D-alanine carboxypeptidase/D-alanyl-D-alanine-endopeptidase (penicillin-binding protein 4)